MLRLVVGRWLDFLFDALGVFDLGLAQLIVCLQVEPGSTPSRTMSLIRGAGTCGAFDSALALISSGTR